MLQTLHVRNLALVESATISFQPGLSVVTGETGAGKSILIGALKLLLGERADKTLIRSGEDSCSVEAQFHLEDPEWLNQLLEEVGLSSCEDGQLIIRRVIKKSSGQALINDHPVTLQFLKKLGGHLVDMHGPYDHQSLLHPETQMEILDAFGHHHKAQAGYLTSYETVRELHQRRNSLMGDDTEIAEQLDLLRYRVDEVDSAGLIDGEEKELIEEHTLQANAYRILELVQGAVQALDDTEGGAFPQIANAQSLLDDLEKIYPDGKDWLNEVQSMAVQLQELVGTMQQQVASLEANPQRLAFLEERRATYDTLQRKYRGTVPEILAQLAKWKTRLHDLETREEQLANLDGDISSAEKKMQSAGKKLSAQRKKSAEKMAQGITRHLYDLGFPKGEFSVELEPCEPVRSGLDAIEFGFAPNPGEEMRPLRAIASSGEVARVMLAAKAVLAEHDRVPVLIFDEIDSNVGGEMGTAIGQKLLEVARFHQIISITHLPQVATFGTQHLAVRKTTRAKRTYTEVTLVEGETRVEEIARMLGGKSLTKVTMQHARELLHHK